MTGQEIERKIKKTDKETQKLEKKIKNYADAGEDIDKIATEVERSYDMEYFRETLFLLKQLKEEKTKIKIPNFA